MCTRPYEVGDDGIKRKKGSLEIREVGRYTARTLYHVKYFPPRFVSSTPFPLSSVERCGAA